MIVEGRQRLLTNCFAAVASGRVTHRNGRGSVPGTGELVAGSATGSAPHRGNAADQREAVGLHDQGSEDYAQEGEWNHPHPAELEELIGPDPRKRGPDPDEDAEDEVRLHHEPQDSRER